MYPDQPNEATLKQARAIALAEELRNVAVNYRAAWGEKVSTSDDVHYHLTKLAEALGHEIPC